MIEAREETAAQVVAVKMLTRKLAAKEGELTKLRQDQASASEVQEVFQTWQYLCGHSKTKLVEKRRELIAARIKEEEGVEDILEAIRGFSRFPYVNSRGRSAVGAESERQDKIEQICRDGTWITKGLELAERADREDGSHRPGHTPWPVELMDRSEVVRTQPNGVDTVPIWVIPCPSHGNGQTLEAGGVLCRWGKGGSIRFKCFQCEEGEVLAAFERLRDGGPKALEFRLEGTA